MKVHLIRHTTPDIDSGVCYGQTDLEVANTFADERDVIHAKLETPYDILFTSPLRRCAKLADTIDAKEKISDNRIMEYDFGDWELRPWDQFVTAEDKIWMDNFVHQPAPNGESLVTMQTRVKSFWDELIELPVTSVAVVTHSGVQRLIHADILQTPLTHVFRLQLDFGAVLEVSNHQTNAVQTIKHL